jgi:hypothetical protein
MDKKPIVADTRYVDWEYIESEEHKDFFPHVHDSVKACGVDAFIGQKLTGWNDEMIMQFYATTHFYPDGRIVWMAEGQKLSSTVEEWAGILNAPVQKEDDVDVYGIQRKIMTQWPICTRKFQQRIWRSGSLVQSIISRQV